MAYRFKLKETVGNGARRIAREQLAAAERVLTAGEVAHDEAVHQARKGLKKLRGLIRLIRSEMGSVYAQENASYRETAALLATARDAAVLVETLDAVQKAAAAQLDAAAMDEVRRTLIARRDASAGDAQELQSRVEQVVAQLAQAHARVASWPIDEADAKTIRKGLEMVYGQGREGFKLAYAAGTPEAFHDWRKHAKYAWYHTRLLEASWPALMKVQAQALSDLADGLGFLHDLSVLKETLKADPEAFGFAEQVGALVEVIDEQMARQVALAQPMGDRLFAEKGPAYSRRMMRYWKAARR